MTLYSQSRASEKSLSCLYYCRHSWGIWSCVQNKTDQPVHNISKGSKCERLRASTHWIFSVFVSIWMFQFCHMCLRGILPWASCSSFFCSSSGISGPLRHRSCHPRHVSWEPFLHHVLPWLLSPTAVWVSQLSPYLPAAPASSAVHCAKCEVIKTEKLLHSVGKRIEKLISVRSGSMRLNLPDLKALQGCANYYVHIL